MNRFTLLNITASQAKFDFVYVFTLIVVSGLAYAMVIMQQQKYESYKNQVDPIKDDFDDIHIARYSLFVRNLPRNMGVEELQKTLTQKMLKMFPVNPETRRSNFVKARVIGDYNKLYKLCVRLKQNIDKLNIVRKENKELKAKGEPA